MSTIRPPAPRPCQSCPYRRDVPSGVWAVEEYEKLPAYDRPTAEQPIGVFLCHQHDRGDVGSRVCGGWAGCHDADESLALRFAVARGAMDIATAEAVRDYRSPVALFGSGREAAEHGMAEILQPGDDAAAAIAKISRKRHLH